MPFYKCFGLGVTLRCQSRRLRLLPQVDFCLEVVFVDSLLLVRESFLVGGVCVQALSRLVESVFDGRHGCFNVTGGSGVDLLGGFSRCGVCGHVVPIESGFGGSVVNPRGMSGVVSVSGVQPCGVALGVSLKIGRRVLEGRL